MLDDLFRRVYKPNLLVPWYLMASYCYHQKDTPIISDGLYDWICQTLHDYWGVIHHQHKYLIDQGQLKAGTGYALPYSVFPRRIIGGAEHLQQLMNSKR